MLRIFQDTHYQFREEIRKLYMDTFSHGDAAQHIDPEELDNEIRLTYEEGMMMVAVDDDDESKLTGALFVYPLQYDSGFNPELSDVCDKVHTPYIAEVMVREKYRGRGLGRKMLKKTLGFLKENRFREVFIRVWNKNFSALRLYTDAGFEVVGKIFQWKLFTDRKTRFLMEKLYLKRGL
ncbi:MAG: GNAT family N-acetyltransferase [Paludibacter sp.]|nr:GNAT family N-acetyltransferase [Paludibacter sp.]